MRLPFRCRFSFIATESRTAQRPLGPVQTHFLGGKQPLAVVFDQAALIHTSLGIMILVAASLVVDVIMRKQREYALSPQPLL